MRPTNPIAGTELFEVWPRGLYCGPAALVALTGRDYASQLRPVINAARGASAPNRGVLGLPTPIMLAALAVFGYRTVDVDIACHRPAGSTCSLARFVEMAGGEPVLIEVTGHYVVAHNGRVVDNAIRFGCPVERHPARRKAVRHAWLVKRPDAMQAAQLFD